MLVDLKKNVYLVCSALQQFLFTMRSAGDSVASKLIWLPNGILLLENKLKLFKNSNALNLFLELHQLNYIRSADKLKEGVHNGF